MNFVHIFFVYFVKYVFCAYNYTKENLHVFNFAKSTKICKKNIYIYIHAKISTLKVDII